MPVLEHLDGDAALKRVQDALGAAAIQARLNFGQVDVTCSRADVRDVVTKLRDTDGLGCEFFTFLSAIDRSEYGGPDDPGKAGGLEVLIHLYSPDHAVNVNVHVPVAAEGDAQPTCPSIADLFGGARWHERETHEMFGIDFEGHPELTHLYLPEDFEGNPLLRSFKLPSRIVKEWPGAKDPEEAAAGGR